MTLEIPILTKIFQALILLFFATVVYFIYKAGRNGLGTKFKANIDEDQAVRSVYITKKDVFLRLVIGLALMIVIGFIVGGYVFPPGAKSDCTRGQIQLGMCDESRWVEPSLLEKVETVTFWVTLLSVPFAVGCVGAYSEVNRKERK